ncbi:GNAT family N-acetyltransferase [Nocardia panacis]|nr:GNAT family N-acetyltransferase [Nocardia panacis]
MRGNTPEFFAPEELAEFAEFLDDPGEYFVVEEDGRTLACGGWAIKPDGTASLCWGMVVHTHHRRGIGSYLFRERMRLIREDGTASAVKLVTSQHSRPFYERLGFTVTGIRPEGFAPGLDAVDMRWDRPVS